MPEPISILCKKCNLASYNTDDIEHRYCGWCHEFHVGEDAYELRYPMVEARPPAAEADGTHQAPKGHSER
jgi:hypothetical protein